MKALKKVSVHDQGKPRGRDRGEFLASDKARWITGASISEQAIGHGE